MYNLTFTIMTNFIKVHEVIASIEKLKKEVMDDAMRTVDCLSKEAYLYGEDAIRLFCDKFTSRKHDYSFDCADSKIEGLKLTGSSKFVYIAKISVATDRRAINSGIDNPYITIKYIEKCIEYNGVILRIYGWNCKTYEFYIFGEEYVEIYKRCCKAPQKVGTVTNKKMQMWIDYLQAEKEAQENIKKNLKKARNAKIQAFKEELCELANVPMEKLQGCESGTIHKKLFSIEWHAPEETGICWTEIKVRLNKAFDKELLRTLKEKGLLENE